MRGLKPVNPQRLGLWSSLAGGVELAATLERAEPPGYLALRFSVNPGHPDGSISVVDIPLPAGVVQAAVSDYSRRPTAEGVCLLLDRNGTLHEFHPEVPETLMQVRQHTPPDYTFPLVMTYESGFLVAFKPDGSIAARSLH